MAPVSPGHADLDWSSRTSSPVLLAQAGAMSLRAVHSTGHYCRLLLFPRMEYNNTTRVMSEAKERDRMFRTLWKIGSDVAVELAVSRRGGLSPWRVSMTL